MAQERRKDKARVVLKTGEGQRNNGTYYYRWQDRKGKRHYIYAKSLPELRMREKEVEKDKIDGIKGESRFTTVNDLYELWKQIKRGLKNTTYENYTYMYEMFAKNDIGKLRISTLKKSDVKRFYNKLADERGLKASTIDSIHTVLLPHFSCHNLRHTFTTRMVEAGVNVKVIQDALGHQDIQTTMNIYADVTKELKKSEFAGLDGYFRNGTGTGNKEENEQSTNAGADGT